jgi:hypothetical protein
MDLNQLTEGLKSLSPFVAVLVLIGALAFRWFDYREKKLTSGEEAEKERRSQEDHDNILALCDIGRQTTSKQSDMEKLLRDHGEAADLRFQQEMEVFKQILRQLISLNASSTGGLSMDNAKLIVQYQWNWCRDETSRVIQNSIRNNHFRGDEERVARSVYRAWNHAANDSLTSVGRLRGVTYPYQGLYAHHVALIWDLVWEWAIPVYHTSRKNEEAFEDALRDLDGVIRSLFDQVFATHVMLVEDVDAGVLYDHVAGDALQVNAANLSVPNDITKPMTMAQSLATYSEAGSSISSAHLLTPATLKERMASWFKAQPGTTRQYQKTRSSADLMPPPTV